MNYNYNQVKVKVIHIENWLPIEDIEKIINRILKEIQDNGGIIEDIDYVMVERKDVMRTIFTYREITSCDE